MMEKGGRRNYFFGLLVACLTPGVMTTAYASKADPDNEQQVKRGKLVYKKFCSLCHGVNLEGQPNWRVRNAEGKLPAPPHDESGHTWHHADELLFGITKYGLVPPYGPKNYKNDMPAWKDTLSDDDIWAVLAYIKSQWPEELRQAQEETNRR
ncbi:c-type cytochrome [Kaarinaea lacus]